jgi:hypothetical protein
LIDSVYVYKEEHHVISEHRIVSLFEPEVMCKECMSE